MIAKLLNNGLTTVGIGAIVYAAALLHPALAWFVGGLAAVIVGVAGARFEQLKQRKPIEAGSRP